MAGTSRGRRVTSGDVAKEAGVSRATVSYVLNDSPHQKIAEATRERVWEAAARLGYAPSAAARALRTGRSDIVLGVLPDWPIHHVLGRLIQQLTNAFAEHELTSCPGDRLEDGLVGPPLPQVLGAGDDLEHRRRRGVDLDLPLDRPVLHLASSCATSYCTSVCRRIDQRATSCCTFPVALR